MAAPRLMRHLGWLQRALDVEPPTFPETLDVGNGVAPVVDVVQGGWFDHHWLGPVNVSQAASTAAAVKELLVLDTAALAWIYILHTGGAGALSVDVGYYPQAGPTSAILIASPSIAVGAKASHVAIFTDPKPIYVPSRWVLYIGFPTTGVGESFNAYAVYTAHPEGAKPY